MVRNLIPITLGNIVGGAVTIGAVYYYIADKNKKIIQYATKKQEK